MSSNIRDEYVKQDPKLATKNIRNATGSVVSLILSALVEYLPHITMLLWGLFPEWIQVVLPLDALSTLIVTLLHLVAALFGVSIVISNKKSQ